MIVPLPERSPIIARHEDARWHEHWLRVHWHNRRGWSPGTYGRKVSTISARLAAARLRMARRAS